MSGPNKRPRVAQGSPNGPTPRRQISSPSKQPSLRDLFEKSAAGSESRRAPLAQQPLNRSTEEQELEWAIQASLREAEAVAAAAASSSFGNDAPIKSVGKAQSNVPAGSDVHDSEKLADTTSNARPFPRRLQDQNVESTSGVNSRASCSNEATSRDGSSPFLEQFAAPAVKTETPQPPASKNAFTKLMTSHSEAKEWAQADAVEARNYAGPARSRAQKRTAPFYKVLTGMPISVDAFRFGEVKGCNAYFLSHFHADHYGGLTSAWTHGPIYCSQTTANLVRTSLYVNEMHICPIPMNTPTIIPKTGGVSVTLLDANHCPGSCLFLFEGPQTRHILPSPPGVPSPAIPPPHVTFRYLHCGDFRASPRHSNHPSIKGKRLDIIYLDTTYCNPRYCFPAQEMVVGACAERVRQLAPEQCAEGQRRVAAGLLEPEEDWRTAPLAGKRLASAREAARNKRTGEALQDWLNKRGIITEDAETSAVKAEDAKEAGDGDDKEDDEEDFGDLDFRDEEIAFRGDISRASSVAPGDNERQGEIGTPSDIAVKDEPFSDDEKEGAVQKGEIPLQQTPAAEPQECQDGESPISVKMEEPALDALEIDEYSGLGERAIKDEVPQVKSEVRSEPAIPAKTEDNYPHVLVVVGTYTIGKEKVVLGCARALGTKVYCADKRKYRVYAQLEDPELHSLLTRDPKKAYVHVTSLMTINGDALKEHVARMRAEGMRIDRAVAFRPTGWTYRPPAGMDVVSPSLERLIQWNQGRVFTAAQLFPTRDSTPHYAIYGVPYSEHSSFFELTAFCLSVEYGRIIATVNVGSANSRAKMGRWFDKWRAEKKRREGVPVDARSLDYF